MPCSRRQFLASSLLLPAVASAQRNSYDSESKEFLDPVTEVVIQRMTSEANNSFLLPPAHRSISRRSDQVLIANDREGVLRLYFLDLKSGTQRLVSPEPLLNPSAACLLPDDRSALFLTHSRQLRSTSARFKSVDLPSGSELLEGPIALFDGTAAVLLTKSASSHHIMLWNAAGLTPLLTHEGVLASLRVAPRQKTLLFRRDAQLCSLALPATKPALLPLDAASMAGLQWDWQGSAFLFAHTEPPNRVSIEEYDFATRKPRWSARTSQYSEFMPNRDSSVFVGASKSKASPLVLIMLRVTKRELAIAEHRSSGPVYPMFTPNSQYVLYQTDRLGKSCVFGVKVNKLVEETAEET